MTLDQVIAGNVTRFREAKEWTMQDLADRLKLSRHDVLAYEGRRADRKQRPFRWSELVALCYGLDVTLYELVLPADSHTHVREPALLHLKMSDVSEFGFPNRSDLGITLFGISGDSLLDEAHVKTFAGLVQQEMERRREALEPLWAALREIREIDFAAGMRRAMKVAQELATRLPPGTTGEDLIKMEKERNQTPAEMLQTMKDEEKE